MKKTEEGLPAKPKLTEKELRELDRKASRYTPPTRDSNLKKYNDDLDDKAKSEKK